MFTPPPPSSPLSFPPRAQFPWHHVPTEPAWRQGKQLTEQSVEDTHRVYAFTLPEDDKVKVPMPTLSDPTLSFVGGVLDRLDEATRHGHGSQSAAAGSHARRQGSGDGGGGYATGMAQGAGTGAGARAWSTGFAWSKLDNKDVTTSERRLTKKAQQKMAEHVQVANEKKRRMERYNKMNRGQNNQAGNSKTNKAAGRPDGAAKNTAKRNIKDRQTAAEAEQDEKRLKLQALLDNFKDDAGGYAYYYREHWEESPVVLPRPRRLELSKMLVHETAWKHDHGGPQEGALDLLLSVVTSFKLMLEPLGGEGGFAALNGLSGLSNEEPRISLDARDKEKKLSFEWSCDVKELGRETSSAAQYRPALTDTTVRIDYRQNYRASAASQQKHPVWGEEEDEKTGRRKPTHARIRDVQFHIKSVTRDTLLGVDDPREKLKIEGNVKRAAKEGWIGAFATHGKENLPGQRWASEVVKVRFEGRGGFELVGRPNDFQRMEPLAGNRPSVEALTAQVPILSLRIKHGTREGQDWIRDAQLPKRRFTSFVKDKIEKCVKVTTRTDKAVGLVVEDKRLNDKITICANEHWKEYLPMMRAKTYTERPEPGARGERASIDTWLFFRPNDNDLEKRKDAEFLTGTIERRHEDGTYDVNFKVHTPKKLESAEERLRKKKELKLKAKRDERAARRFGADLLLDDQDKDKDQDAAQSEGPKREEDGDGSGRQVTVYSVGRDLLFSTRDQGLLELDVKRLTWAARPQDVERGLTLPKNAEDPKVGDYQAVRGFIVNVSAHDDFQVVVRTLHLAIAAELPATEDEFSLSLFVYDGDLETIEKQRLNGRPEAKYGAKVDPDP